MSITGISGSCPLPGSGEKRLASTLHMEKMINLHLSVLVGDGYLQHGNKERNRSRRLTCDLYFIPNDMQLKDAMAIACGDSMRVGVVTGANWEAAKVAILQEQEGDDVKSE